MSRALGDFNYKQRDDLHAKQQRVSPFPDIKIVERTPVDDVLLVACDGLWDVFSSEEAIDEVRELMLVGEGDVTLMAEEMLDASLIKGVWDYSSIFYYVDDLCVQLYILYGSSFVNWTILIKCLLVCTCRLQRQH